MKKRLCFSVILLSFLQIFSLFGIDFSGLTLSNDDRLLFNAEFESQKTLFVSNLVNLDEPAVGMQQLTAFPERLEVVNKGSSIFVLNRFGAARIPTAGGLPVPLAGFPSFAAGNVPLKGRALDFAASSDGRWYIYLEPVSAAFGNLFLVETTSGSKKLISEKVELPREYFPARWSPDSRLFVYSKGGSLYYFPIIQDLSAMADERFRQIGEGGITSVLWAQNGNFYYFRGNTLYRVINSELFTRTIYGDFLSVGNAAAVIPFEFESDFDRFWIAPDSRSILINKRGNSLFLFMLGENQYNNSALPHIMLPQGTGGVNVLWSPSRLTIISSLKEEIIAWRFEISGNQVKSSIPENVPASADGVLSSDGTKAAFWGENGLELWDFANWRLIQKISDERIFSCAWSGGEIIAGNAKFIEAFNVSGDEFTRRRICLSGADESGFEENPRAARIIARAAGEWFATDCKTAWQLVSNPRLRQASLSSDRFRVFLETQPAGYFKNIPMIRNTLSVGTTSLVSNYSTNRAYNPGQKKQIALCFDLYDDDTGLSLVLRSLSKFNIKASFFMNGDFIRRNPQAASAVVQAGHEAASMFYAPIDLSDARYTVTSEFITQGLARNEDEFFRATGKELSSIWHPPFYRSSALIESAAASAGYVSSSRDIDPGDWISRNEALRLGIRQSSASETIEQIIEKVNASTSSSVVIPIRLGLNPGGRDDYLYQYIEVLLDALVRSGCEIVSVSAVGQPKQF